MDFVSPHPTTAWTVVFCLLLATSLLVRFWLASRQIRHVAEHRKQVPPAFVHTVNLAAHHKAADYTLAKERLGLIDMTWGAALLVAWTLLGGLDTLNQALLAWLGTGMWQQLALLGAFFLIGGLLELPLAWYRTFRVEEQFGFNKTTLRMWLADGVKDTLLSLVIGLPLATVVLWLMQVAGPLWWLWAWAVWMCFNVLLLVLYPTWIAPLFNKFEPLQDTALTNRIDQLMQRCGFTSKGFYVMDGSRRSAHANAYFTGFGPAKRVVFFDTLLQQLTPGEVDAVLAHELGHFKHHHITKRMVGLFAFSLLGFSLLGGLSGQAWFYAGLGVMPNLNGSNSALALLLFISVAPLVTLFVTPVMSATSRRHEFEADAYAVQHTCGQDLSNALLKLYKDNASTLTPDPLFVKFYYSHPPAGERLARMAA
jgi:STE24 endopeptidase